MKVNYNVSAMIANNALSTNDSKLADSLEKLSSGMKIANAKDNPSGLAMARRMNSQIESLKTADDSTNDGISIVETADGVLSEVQDMVQRMNELAVKSANGALTSSDRSVIQNEVAQLKEEITRVSKTTQFNGQNILDGSFDLKGYATIGGTTHSTLKVSTYSDQVTSGTTIVSGLKCTYDSTTNTVKDVSVDTVQTPDRKPEAAYKASELTVTSSGDIITLSAADGMSIQLKADQDLTGTDSINLELTGKGAMTVQVGANEGQTLDMRIPTLSLSNMGLTNTDVSTQDGASAALNQISDALQYISQARSRLGAYQNRLEHTDSSLDVTNENMTSAYSRIMDVDMAEEMTVYSTQQVLSQAGTSMLAQANKRPSEVLQLLQ
ncbi:MAG: flagellin FliC3 [Butyrivibrio sp.]|jgi:flagellin|nr:flagellin FliC3 [Butyrivibrio sp.]